MIADVNADVWADDQFRFESASVAIRKFA